MLTSASGKSVVQIAEPIDAKSIEECHFYHVTELPGHGVIQQEKSWDLRGRFVDYVGHVDVRGKTFLDIGAASGFISFEAERSGAKQVYSFDADSSENIDHLPYTPRPDSPRVIFEQTRRAFWFAHKALNSKVQAIYGDIYKMVDQVPEVDIVLVAQILVHLERPVKALTQAAAAARETLIIVDGSFEDERPLVVFLGGKGNYYSWYHHSVGFYREFLPIVGFELVSATKNVYSQNHPHIVAKPEVWTFVARRTNKYLPPFQSYVEDAFGAGPT